MQMMRHLIAPVVLAFSMASTVPSRAADLSVNGQIRSDGACSIALGNGGVIDLGNLSRKDIYNRSDYTELAMPLTINCQHPTKVGVDVIDNRAGTLPPGFDNWGVLTFGLGNPDIGFYSMAGWNGDADGRYAGAIQRRKGESTWGAHYGVNGETISWRVVVDGNWQVFEPVAFKTLTNTLRIDVHFNDLAFSDELALDGSATLELRYL